MMKRFRLRKAVAFCSMDRYGMRGQGRSVVALGMRAGVRRVRLDWGGVTRKTGAGTGRRRGGISGDLWGRTNDCCGLQTQREAT